MIDFEVEGFHYLNLLIVLENSFDAQKSQDESNVINPSGLNYLERSEMIEVMINSGIHFYIVGIRAEKCLDLIPPVRRNLFSCNVSKL